MIILQLTLNKKVNNNKALELGEKILQRFDEVEYFKTDEVELK